MARQNQYKGTLNAKQIADGMNAATRNAARLADDAQLLLDNGRFPAAFSAAALSIEETTKCSILRKLACAKTAAQAKSCWRMYRTHTMKNFIWPVPAMVAGGARKLSDFSKLAGSDPDYPNVLEAVKQIAIYTDYSDDGQWSEPAEEIDEEVAQLLVQTAKILADWGRDATDTEIELWKKHVGWLSDEEGLRKFFKEMQDRGLAPPGPDAVTGLLFDVGPDGGGNDPSDPSNL